MNAIYGNLYEYDEWKAVSQPLYVVKATASIYWRAETTPEFPYLILTSTFEDSVCDLD